MLLLRIVSLQLELAFEVSASVDLPLVYRLDIQYIEIFITELSTVIFYAFMFSNFVD